IMLGGLQNLPGELYEAATIDGAGVLRSFLSITIPLMRPVILFAVVLSTIGTFSLFTEPYVLFQGTSGAGPARATLTPVLHLYHNAFGFLKFGYASSIAYVYFGVLFVLTALQWKLFGRDGGFAFAKYRFPGREALFLVLLGSLVIPFEVTMVPLYVLYQRIGWIDTHWPLLIPGTANAFGIFFMRQIIRGVPDELIDTARIDGAGEFRIFTRVIVPVVTPALTSLGIIFFMSSWNSFLWPLVLLRSSQRLTAAVAVARLQGSISAPYALILAGSVLLTLPPIVFFLILQNRF